jgi:hypothetical protein
MFTVDHTPLAFPCYLSEQSLIIPLGFARASEPQGYQQQTSIHEQSCRVLTLQAEPWVGR